MKRTMRMGMVRSVLIAMAPLMILLIIINFFSWRISSLRSEESIKSALKIQAFSINDVLSETEKSVKNIIINNFLDILVIKKNSQDLNGFLSKQAILNQMKSHTAATSTEDALFLYSPANGYLLLNAPETVGLQRVELCDHIPGIFAGEESANARWHLRDVGGTVYAFMWRRAGELYVCGIVPIRELAAIILNESADILAGSNLFFIDTELCVSVEADGTVSLLQTEPKESYLFSHTLPDSDVAICFAYESFQLLPSVGMPMLFTLALSIVIFCCMPMLISRISLSFTRPFHDIQQGMRLVQQGDFKTQIEGSFPYCETEDMRCTFNEMVRQIMILKNDVYEEKLLREKTEANFYQLQVKPHFYLNSLNQIHILAQMGDTEGVSQAALQLAEYFRYLLRSNGETVILSDELKHIQNFFLIQKRKYPAGHEFRIDLPPDMLMVKIPPLFLMTFAENSIKYATGAYDKLKLLLRGERAGERGYKLILEDSGPGFDGNVLRALQAGEKLRTIDGRKCIGIANARQRLRFIYGDKAEVSFRNGGELGGACVEVTIPETKGEERI